MSQEMSERISIEKNPSEKYHWKDGRERADRPIDFHLQDIVNRLRQEQVMIVQAETGVGKTSRIPQAILDSDPDASVIMTQTKRPAVRMNGTFIAEEMGSEIGDEVGWRLRGEPVQVSDDTRLTLVIDQSLTNKIRRDKKLPDGVIIIDEAHERSIQIDVLLSLVKEYLPSSPNTRLLITSATIDTEKFREFFDAKDPVVAKNGSLFPVEVRPQRLQYGEHHTEGAIRAVKDEVIDAFIHDDLEVQAVVGKFELEKIHEGSVLVLLPGKEDIRQALSEIKKYAEDRGISDRLQLFEFHSQVDADVQRRIEEPVPKGKLRIVCSTEILRSSVTVPDTVTVVDSLQVKRHSTDENGVTHLMKVPISGAEADQGKGRAGRQRPGIYIPVSFNSEYEDITDREGLGYWPQPAIMRESLTSVALQIASVELNMRELPMIDKPEDIKIDVAIKRLQRLGALDENEQITEKGKRLVEFPIDPERAQVLLEAEKRGVLPEAVIAMAVLENEGMMYVPRKDEKSMVVTEDVLDRIIKRANVQRAGYFSGYTREKSENWAQKNQDGTYTINPDSVFFPLKQKAREVAAVIWEEFAGENKSDFVAAVNAFRAYKTEENRLFESFDPQKHGYNKFRWVESSLRKWCTLHSLNFKKVKGVERTVKELWDEARESGLYSSDKPFDTREFDPEELTKSLISGLIDGVSVRYGERYSGPRSDFIQISLSSAADRNAQIVLAENVRKAENASRGYMNYYSDMAAPVKIEWLMEVVPQLYETGEEQVPSYDMYEDKVKAEQVIKFNSYEVGTRTTEVTGEKAAEALAEALVHRSYLFPERVMEFSQRNEAVIRNLNDLWARSKGRIMDRRFTHADLINFYKERLHGASSFREIRELLENNKNLLDLPLENFVSEEEQKEIRSLHPDTREILGQEYEVKYSYDEYSKKLTARISLTTEQALQLTEYPAFADEEVVIEVKDKYGYPLQFSNTLENLKRVLGAHQKEEEYRKIQDEERSLSAAALRSSTQSLKDLYYKVVFDRRLKSRIPYYLQAEIERTIRRAEYGMGVVSTTIHDLENYEKALRQLTGVSSGNSDVEANPLEASSASRFNALKDLLDQPIDNLKEIAESEKKKDIGKYRLAIAALASKGIEGMEVLLEEKRWDPKLFDELEKALEKAKSGALKNSFNRDVDLFVAQTIENTKKQIDIFKILQLTSKSPTIKEFLGDNQESGKKFRQIFYDQLHEAQNLPQDPDLEEEILKALEKMTS